MLNGSMEHAQLEFDENLTGVWRKTQGGVFTESNLAVERQWRRDAVKCTVTTCVMWRINDQTWQELSKNI